MEGSSIDKGDFADGIICVTSWVHIIHACQCGTFCTRARILPFDVAVPISDGGGIKVDGSVLTNCLGVLAPTLYSGWEVTFLLEKAPHYLNHYLK